MVSKLDQSVGEIVTALRHRDMLQNSIIIFMSDNGAPTMGIHSNRGSNYPLRGVSFNISFFRMPKMLFLENPMDIGLLRISRGLQCQFHNVS